jgi:hypothetical protein
MIPSFARTSLTLAFVGLSLSLSGCNLNHAELESMIKSKFKDKGVKLDKVKCPDRPRKKGDTFDCTAKTEDDDEITVHVEQKDAQGSVEFNLEGAVVEADKLGDSIEEKIGTGADVKCDAKKVVLPEGKKIKCKVKIEGQEHTLELKAKDDEGNVSWKIVD